MTATNAGGGGRRRRSAPLRAGMPLPAAESNGHGPATREQRDPGVDPGADGHLTVKGLDFSYGSLQILFGVDLEVERGSAVALLGTNGAGKSTLVKVIAGLERPSAGTIELDGHDITDLPAEERATRGLTLVEGGKAMFPSMNVLDNLRIGAYPRLEDRASVDAAVDEALEVFPQLQGRLDQLAGTLSGGEQQMLAIGRAIVAGSELLIVDELSLGLAPVVMQQIVQAVEHLVENGKTIVLIEQSLNVAASLCEQAYFLEKGEVRFSGPTADLLERGDLARSVFFGTDEGEG